MKTRTLEVEGLTLERLLQEATTEDVVFLTSQGQIRFAVMPADEGDPEICALRSNHEFLSYLSGCEDRAKTRPRKSLQRIRELYGSPPQAASGPAAID